jgi:hypothetical protein
MAEMRPATSAEPAQWLLRSGVTWWDLVRYGAPRFDAYLRIAFDSAPHAAGQADEDPDEDRFRLALGVLARHTGTPATAYAAIWEGWSSGLPTVTAPRLLIPNRTMLLFTGPVDVMRDAPALAWRVAGRVNQEPHLVWPDDHAWCVACEVDEEIEFTVGCGEQTAQALAAAMPGAVRRVGYGDAAPLYRDGD